MHQRATRLLNDFFSIDSQREGLAVRPLDSCPIDAKLQRFNMFLLPWDERGSQNHEARDIALMHRWAIFLSYQLLPKAFFEPCVAIPDFPDSMVAEEGCGCSSSSRLILRCVLTCCGAPHPFFS